MNNILNSLFFLFLCASISVSQHAVAATVAPLFPSSSYTQKVHAHVLEMLDFTDPEDFVEAWQGFIAPLPDGGRIFSKTPDAHTAQKSPVWDLTAYAFLGGITADEYVIIREQAGPETANIKQALRARLTKIFSAPNFPTTANPSLWRQSQLCMIHGLFEVVPNGIYQVRNADLSNLTIFEGPEGIVVADPLISAETADAALRLYYIHRHGIAAEDFDTQVASLTRSNPQKAVAAVIFSHSHIDHYGGVAGVLESKYTGGKTVPIVAPEGFMEAAVAENVLAGTAMNRRAIYMYGRILPPSPWGNIGTGLGMTTSRGTTGLATPTLLVTKTGQKERLAGLEFEFLLAPDTEAPAEMHWYIPTFKALTAAENCCHTLHNTYTLRGAKTRDPLLWSKYLDETARRWGSQATVLYGMHHWPVWNSPETNRVQHVLTLARDGYRFINDQTLRLANKGYTADDIAETLVFPQSLQQHWAMRGYYGTLSHNVKATFSLYLGWYDGHPANLHSLPRKAVASKYVLAMGGSRAVFEKAQAVNQAGEYRWAAELINHLLWFRLYGDIHAHAMSLEEQREYETAKTLYAEARRLQAEAFVQMGYQAESGPWRNNYLSGALELVDGLLPAMKKAAKPIVGRLELEVMPLAMIFDYLAIHIDPAINRETRRVDFHFTDVQEAWRVTLSNAALHAHALSDTAMQTHEAKATECRLDKRAFLDILLGEITLETAVARSLMTVSGDPAVVQEITALGKSFPAWFDIVAP